MEVYNLPSRSLLSTVRRHGASKQDIPKCNYHHIYTHIQAATQLMPAARDGDIATVKRLLTEERVDVNVQDGVSTIFVFFVMEDKVVFEAALWSVRSRYSSPPPPPPYLFMAV